MVEAAAIGTAVVISAGSAAIRAAVLLHRPVQYFSPALRLLTKDPGIALRVYYWEVNRDGVHDPGFGRHVRWNTDLYSGYDWWTAPPRDPTWRRLMAARRVLAADRPEVILSFGWHSPITRVGMLYAQLVGIPLLFYGDSNIRGASAGWRARLRAVVLRRLFRVAGAVAVGDANREFYLSYRMPPERIHPGVLPADVEAFAAAQAATPARPPVRPFTIGFVGKFIPCKAVDDLISAVAQMPRDEPWELRLIGDGPLRTELAMLVAEHGLTDRVHFLGFRNTDEVPALVADLDALVLPSRREPRGLVAVEAMAARVATVVSSATGVWGPADAIRDGETGLVYAVGDIAALARHLESLRTDPHLRARLARSGQTRAVALGPHAFATTTATALTSTVWRSRVLTN